ncbi:hypothetical protein GCM10009742_06620 [Kribbella karoonensis]|uniref:Uncharacterized protein n=1 Tax=Kribbella karoonensis TaxID=324851 RepID=A0ABN2CZN6_9ACTN
MEEFGTDVTLEGTHLLRNGRLGDPHELGGLGEVPGVGDGDEVGELVELHDAIIGSVYRTEIELLFAL